ncbi:MAG: autotransporter domain-containing protein, partial [Alphaproteobacteria bacterium]|nr:autotransporter domain-containing protein [Alphaproteobacteria bacterium]
GDIIFNSTSTTTISGDQSSGVFIASGATLKGNLTLGGTFSMTPTTPTSTTASALVGVLVEGQVQGNVSIPSGGVFAVQGAGAQGMSIQGTGVTGSLTVGGNLSTIGAATPTTQQQQLKQSTAVQPEASSALAIGANVGNGIEVLGPNFLNDQTVAPGAVAMQGRAATVFISPSVNSLYTTVPQAAPLVIGVYGDTYDPGFSFYNRGTVTAQTANANNLANDSYNTSAVDIAGASSALPTQLTGGIYNSGTISAAARSTGTVAKGNTATALAIDGYAMIGENLAAKNGTDQASLVNTNATNAASGGVISASVSGTRGGTATAILINTNGSLPSILNSGTIKAGAATTDKTLTNALQAVAIQDLSGTLTSIYNTGAILAQAGVSNGNSLSALDNNSQLAVAIDLHGNTTTPSGAGVSIIDQSTSASNATILGNINFGTGDNQVLTINGTGRLQPQCATGRICPDATVTGNVSYGSGTATGGDKLTIGSYGALSGIVTSVAGSGVAVDVKQYGTLVLQNTTAPLYATDLTVESYGALSLGVSESLSKSGLATIAADHSASIAAHANLGVTFNSFVPQGSTNFVLVTAPKGSMGVTDLATYNTSISTSVANGGTMPFLFASASLQCFGTSPGCTAPVGATDELVLSVVPKTKDDPTLGLAKGSYGYQIFDAANTALGLDDVLGSALVNGVHNAKEAQAAYNAFAPNVTGGSRAIAISITDQATGAIAARLRMLNLYGKVEGGTTLWGQEFFQMLKDPGRGAVQADGTRLLSGYKDHGFGFALGIDGGSPKYGWYGGAFTFYSGDVGEIVRDSHTNEEWYILSGYTSWRGKGLFFDSKIDAGYGRFDGKRKIDLTIVANGTSATFTREADNKHAGTLISGGFTTGALFAYGATTLSPMLSVDGLLMREEGYTETNPGTATVGDAFDLKVQPYYAKSLRAFLGGSVRYDLDLWDFFLQPETHAGFRYDFFNNPVNLKAAFAYADLSGGKYGPGTTFTINGPDPSQGNFVLGGSLAATTDTWTLGVNFDFVRGTNGAMEQVGTVNLLGRI